MSKTPYVCTFVRFQTHIWIAKHVCSILKVHDPILVMCASVCEGVCVVVGEEGVYVFLKRVKHSFFICTIRPILFSSFVMIKDMFKPSDEIVYFKPKTCLP